jgi:hypothetical protein
MNTFLNVSAWKSHLKTLDRREIEEGVFLNLLLWRSWFCIAVPSSHQSDISNSVPNHVPWKRFRNFLLLITARFFRESSESLSRVECHDLWDEYASTINNRWSVFGRTYWYRKIDREIENLFDLWDSCGRLPVLSWILLFRVIPMDLDNSRFFYCPSLFRWQFMSNYFWNESGTANINCQGQHSC